MVNFFHPDAPGLPSSEAHFSGRFEFGADVFLQPAVESLLKANAGTESPVGEAATSPELLSQALARREPWSILRGFGGAGNAYDRFADFLDADDGHRRAVLYFPFVSFLGFGPSAEEAMPEAFQHFAWSFMRRWRELLSVSDVRANFVDGDIPEANLRAGALPRVVKAAHLAPWLIQNGLLDIKELIGLCMEAEDPILRESLADAASCLNIPELESFVKRNPARHGNLAAEAGAPLSPARAAWLRRRESAARIGEAASALASELRDAPDFAERFAAACRERENIEAIKATIQGLGLALRAISHLYPGRAHDLYPSCEGALLSLRDSAPDANDAILQLWSRLGEIRILGEGHWERVGAEPPRIDADFAGRRGFIEESAKPLGEAMARLRDDPELSGSVLPALLVFGSRLKGYGESDADLDVAVFVRPGAKFDTRATLAARLHEVFAAEPFGGKAVEFWLAQSGEGLCVRDFPEPDVSLGGSDWVHILFGAAWFGEEATIRELHRRLLPAYFRSDAKAADGRPAREHWMEEMERDVLQYRLMHEGYARFRFPSGGIAGPGMDRLDPGSMFWDSGYRRLATELFLSRVFLPKLGC